MAWNFKIRTVKFEKSDPTEQKWLFLVSKMPKDVIQTIIYATLSIFSASGRHKLLEIPRFGFFGLFRHCVLDLVAGFGEGVGLIMIFLLDIFFSNFWNDK